MSHTKAGEIVARAIDELVAVGASREAIEWYAQPLEMAAINSIAENGREQLLLNLDYKTSDLAIRYRVSQRTIRNWRKAAINKRFVSALVAAEG